MNEEERIVQTNEEATKSENGERFKVINIKKYKDIIKDYNEDIGDAKFYISLHTILLSLISVSLAAGFLLPDYFRQDIGGNINRLFNIAGGIVSLRCLIEAICAKTRLIGNLDRIYDELELNGVDVDKLDEEIEAEEREARGKK